MKNNIFIPQKINVGYQKKSDTYTGKLAYIIYRDEQGNLRKELSWNEWRNKSIPIDEFDNVPMEGFVLNKPAGGVRHSLRWSVRKSYCRIYDPRGFEFEITIENLLYILENCVCGRGKGLEGKFIYGWDGKDLILMPTNSPDYKEIMDYNKIVHEKKSFKATDLIIGATYLTKDNSAYIYMGRFKTYGFGYEYEQDGKTVKCKDYNDIPKITFLNGHCYDSKPIPYKKITNCPYGKMYWFEKVNNKEYLFEQFTSIPKNKFVDCLDDKCTSEYANIYDAMESNYKFSPIDNSKNKYFDMSFDDFYKNATKSYSGIKVFHNLVFKSNVDGKYTKYRMETPYEKNNGTYTVYKYNHDKQCYIEDIDIFPTKERKVIDECGIEKIETKMIPVSIETIYEKMKPVYEQKYLTNGRKYRKIFDFTFDYL